MALVIVMPAVARVTSPAGTISSADMDASCPGHMFAAKQPHSPHAPADPTARCAYCVLLDNAPLLSLSSVLYLPASLIHADSLRVAHMGGTYPLPVLSADPRGPPR
jgi:hypothetical protein